MTEDKPAKPLPSVAEINAYLEQSAARTRMRLPLAKGNAAVVVKGDAPATPSAEAGGGKPATKAISRNLPLQGSKPLATASEPRRPEGGAAGNAETNWQPFATDEKP